MHETAPDPWASPKIPASPPARQELPATGGGSNTALLELHRDNQRASQPSWTAGLWHRKARKML